MPVKGAKLDDELKQHFNVNEDGYKLIVSWLLAALRGRGPFPVLVLTGEQGTGKTFNGRKLRSLVDPNTSPVRALPRDIHDLYVAAMNGAVLVFDNLSGINAEMSDALCRLSTGGGFSARALYTDGDEVLFDGQRPILLTSIVDVASRPDLLDRSLLVLLVVIPDDRRQPEEMLWPEFEKARPRVLGALLDVVAHGLMHLPTTRLSNYPRMADYAHWLAACETAIWSAGMHRAAYDANRASGAENIISDDSVGNALCRYMENRVEHVTTAAELYDELGKLVTDQVRRSKDWPGAPRWLTDRLKRLAPALRKVGITIEHGDREGGTGRRLMTIKKQEVGHHELAFQE
jgi:hypothetical protein